MFMTWKARLCAVSVIMLFGLLLVNSTCAQVAGGTLSGTVTDPSGAVVPQAAVTISNQATGVKRTVSTNSDGFYTAPNLLPGNYDITITARGFANAVRSGIVLTVGAQQVLNVALQLGTASQKVEVTTEGPLVQLATSAIAEVVSDTTVRELPLNGRSWTDLAALQPGVNSIENQPSFSNGGDRGNRGFGSQSTISGVRPQNNNYRLDGISMNDYSNGAPGSVLGGNLGVDAIQEFSVLTTNYSAEYGKTAGGVVNAITRSGADALHGDVYEFLRNSALDARNYFDLGSIPPFRRNQFGGSLGGPIQKHRMFFFADYEGLRQSKGISQLDTVPSLAARNGQLSTGAITVNPASAKYLTFWPQPNAGLLPGGDIGRYQFAAQQVVNENFVTSRVDRTFSDKDSMYGTFLYDRTPYSSPDSLDQVVDGSTTTRQMYILEETHIFRPNLVNVVRFGFNRDSALNNQTISAINAAAADPSLGAVPGRAAAQVKVSGLTPFTGGMGGAATYIYNWNDYQAYDDAFLTHGTHSIKFGGAFERMQNNVVALSNPSGVFTFSSLKNFLSNVPSKFNSGFADTLSPRDMRESLFGAYLQDDWRWRTNLTLNLGVRYEATTVPTETAGRIANLLNITDANPHLGDPYFQNPTLRNFEPRLGFAWDPFHNGKTAIRGGIGLFDVLPLLYQFTIPNAFAAPFFKFGAVGKGLTNTFYSGAYSLLGANSLRSQYVQPDPGRDYVTQWNFNIQREITPGLTAMVGYVGSHGVHQPFRVDDADMVLPTLTPAGYMWPNPVGSGKTINPNYGSIRAMFYDGSSSYNAMEVQLTKRMSHGLQLTGSYTWAKSIDTGSATVAGDQFGNSISSLYWFDPRVNRGLSDFDVGRTLVINGLWSLPSPKQGNPAFWVAKGWQFGGIFKAQDGYPFSATFGTDGDPLGLNSSDPHDFPNRLTGSGCQSAVNPGNPNNYIKAQCFAVPSPITLLGNAGRNTLIGPGLVDLDFSVYKNNPIRAVSENFNVQFRAEFFNVLNRANFAAPSLPGNTDIFLANGSANPVAGLLSSTVTTAREIQFALKVVF